MKTLIGFFLLVSSYNSFASEPVPWQMMLQAPASPLMKELYWFHNFLLVIISAIVGVVLILLAYVCVRYRAKRNPVPANFSHNIAIEVVWTVIPVIILVVIAIPSFRILRLAEKTPPAEMTIKVVGYQWYWTYNYPDHDNISFDSNYIVKANLKPGQKRLLEVDNRIIVPENTTIKFLITGGDVIHSFAIPSLGIKTDAVPGRVNETWTHIAEKGVYYGQCSELCGVNHGFMPIALQVVSKEDFTLWVKNHGKFVSPNVISHGETLPDSNVPFSIDKPIGDTKEDKNKIIENMSPKSTDTKQGSLNDKK